MTAMRIAVAGSGGLARLIAGYIDADTAHQIVFIPRSVCQVPTVGLGSPSDYQPSLRPPVAFATTKLHTASADDSQRVLFDRTNVVL